jgi:hypothetical protein
MESKSTTGDGSTTGKLRSQKQLISKQRSQKQQQVSQSVRAMVSAYTGAFVSQFVSSCIGTVNQAYQHCVRGRNSYQLVATVGVVGYHVEHPVRALKGEVGNGAGQPLLAAALGARHAG